MSVGTTGGAPRGRTRGGWRAPLVPGDGPLSRVPPVAAFAVVAAVFAVAVIVGGVLGALLLGVLAAGVAALLAVAWTRLSPAERLGRFLVLGVLVAIAVSLLTGAGR